MYSIFHVRFNICSYTFLVLILLFSTIFTSTSYAGAAEKWSGTPRQMTIADYGMRTRNGIGVGNVKAANGMINADITQRVTVDGSNATINTRVAIPANDDSFKRNTAKHAKNLLRGGAYAAGAAAAMQLILDGVGWVIDEGGKVKRKPTEDETALSTYQYLYVIGGNAPQKSAESSCTHYKNRYPQPNPNNVRSGFVDSALNCNIWNDYQKQYVKFTISKVNNNQYNPNTPKPPNVSVPDGEMEDAFYNWFKNNPNSITDPVTTYIYSPKDPNGNALPSSPPGEDPSFGQREITDEMMANYMEHRDANLRSPYTTTIGDSTQTDTTQNPDGTKTTTTTNPDGSKTTTRTDTKTDPDTGEITTTVTETTTMPDGSTSTKTETSTQTKPKPETTEIAPFCEYAAIMCTWYYDFKDAMTRDAKHKEEQKSLWDKIKEFFDETPEDNDDTEVEIEELEKPTDKVQLPTSNSECPSLTYNFDLRTFKAQADFSPVHLCEIAEGVYWFFVALGWYLSACILGWRSS